MIWSANRVLHVRGMKWVLNSLTWTIYITKNSQKKTPTLPIYRLTKYNKTPIMNLLEFSYGFCVFHHPKKTKQLRTPRKISPWPSSPVSKAYLHRSLDLGRVKSRSRGASKQLRWFGWGFLHPWKTGPNEFVPPKKGGGLFQLEKYIWTNHWCSENMFRFRGAFVIGRNQSRESSMWLWNCL